jgi:hypothetical protein
MPESQYEGQLSKEKGRRVCIGWRVLYYIFVGGHEFY